MCDVAQTDLNCEGKWLKEPFYRPSHAFALFLSETESPNSWTFQRQIAPCYGEQLTRRARTSWRGNKKSFWENLLHLSENRRKE